MVETAILEALDDCTADVRREAINLVIKQAGGGCCSCQFNQLWLRLALRLVAGSINATLAVLLDSPNTLWNTKFVLVVPVLILSVSFVILPLFPASDRILTKA